MMAMAALDAMGGLIISQYYEGSNNNKWVEIYNPGPSAVDLAADGYRLGLWSNTAREGWKTNGAPTSFAEFSNAIPSGATFLVKNTNAVLPLYAVGDYGGPVANFNGDDSLVLYTGTNYAFANVVDVFGLTNNTAMDTSFVRTNTVTSGSNADFLASEWIQFSNLAVDGAAVDMNERLGYHSTGAAPVVTNVKFFASSAIIDENQGVFEVKVYKNRPEGDVSGSVYLQPESTATEGAGADYTINTTNFTMNGTATSATFTVTINDDAVAEGAETIIMSLVGVVGAGTTSPSVFTLTINPSDQPMYAINITVPTNGTVTTTPATSAASGTVVTITATPSNGYAVASKSVVRADTTNVIMSGNTFVMPGQAVTVTVTFEVFVASSLIISEVADPSDNLSGLDGRFVELYNAGASSIDLGAGTWYLGRQANGGGWANIALTGTVAAAQTYVVAASASNYATAYPTATAPNQTSGSISGNGNDGYFLYSGGNNSNGLLRDAYGVINEDGLGKPWDYTDKRAVRNTGMTAGNQTWTASEWTIASAAFAAMTPGVHPDGAAVFGVTVNRTNGFTVEQGTSATIFAAAANGTAPYTYAWSSSLAESAANTNVFTVLATAPTGTYWAQVVATDNAAQTATNMVIFSVVTPAPKYAINITTPTNGTVTTTPTTEAAEGALVTISAVPGIGYAVATKTVVGADATPVTVTNNTFVMPPQAVTVAVEFADVSTGGPLIISQYYEGTGLNKWIEIYNPGGSAIDLAAAGYRLGQFSNSNRETWKIGAAPGFVVVLSNSIAAGGTYLVSHGSVSNPAYATANQTDGWGFNGDDSVVLYTGTNYAFANVVDAFGLSGNTAADKSFVRTNTVAGGVKGDFNAAEWIEYALADVEAAGASVNERIGYHGVGGMPPAPEIPQITYVIGTGLTFALPLGYALASVYGADSELSGQSWPWILLSSPTDYVVDAGIVTIKTTPAVRRMIRIGLTPGP
jgi:hypothetical protein